MVVRQLDRILFDRMRVDSYLFRSGSIWIPWVYIQQLMCRTVLPVFVASPMPVQITFPSWFSFFFLLFFVGAGLILLRFGFHCHHDVGVV